MNSNEVRKRFLDFFEKKNHKIVKSSPMVSKNDPSLMFINSGMAPFKDYFLNQENPMNKRVANSQKCLRVSRSFLNWLYLLENHFFHMRKLTF